MTPAVLEEIKRRANTDFPQSDRRALLAYVDQLREVVAAADAWLGDDDAAEAAEDCSFTLGIAPLKWKHAAASRDRFRDARKKLGGRRDA